MDTTTRYMLHTMSCLDRVFLNFCFYLLVKKTYVYHPKSGEGVILSDAELVQDLAQERHLVGGPVNMASRDQ